MRIPASVEHIKAMEAGIFDMLFFVTEGVSQRSIPYILCPAIISPMMPSPQKMGR